MYLCWMAYFLSCLSRMRGLECPPHCWDPHCWDPGTWTVPDTEKVFSKCLCMPGSWIPTLKPDSSALVKAAYIKEKHEVHFLSLYCSPLYLSDLIYQYSVIYIFSDPSPFKFLKSNISPKQKAPLAHNAICVKNRLLLLFKSNSNSVHSTYSLDLM